MGKISVVLATFNEEKNIARCLESVKELASEIVVVDGSSADNTVEIAKSFGAEVIVTDNPPIFHINKQKAIDLAKNDWILQLDADEVVTASLTEEIVKVTKMSGQQLMSYQQNLPSKKLFDRHLKLIEQRDGKVGDSKGPFNAFFIPRRNYFLGKYLKYGGTYPDPAIRLIRKGKAYLPCKSVHEQMVVEGRVGWLENYMLHKDSPTFTRYLERNNRYINLMIREMGMEKIDKSFRQALGYLLIKPLWWFMNTLIRHKGILDGYQGILFSFFSAIRFPKAYWRYLTSPEKIRVGFSTSPLDDANQFRGIGQNTRQLLDHLKKDDRVEMIEFNRFNVLKHDINVVHYPAFTFFQRTLPLRKKYPTVVTIHDTIPLAFPEHYPTGIRGRVNLWYQKLALRNVSAVVTISESAKLDIHKYLGVPFNKIYAIPLAVSEEFKVIDDQKQLENTGKKHHLPDKFLVYVGDVNWNKNLVNLTQAVIESGWELVCVGKAITVRDNLEAPELKTFRYWVEEFADNPRVHILGYLSGGQLVDVLNLSTALLLPSFYEGFGLTILEAQACGTVVITAKNSSIPEVAGESVIYVDPNSLESIKEGIKKLDDHILVKRLRDRGFENIKRFSWKRTTDQVVEVYRQC